MDAVERLMQRQKADLVFTDPPYNVDYEGYTEEKLTIQGDKMTPEQFQEFLGSVFSSYLWALKPGGSMYVCHPSSWQREFQGALELSDFEVRCQIIWAKNTLAWGFGRYKFQHEPIFYCHRQGQSDPWYGDKSQSTLWQEKKPAANRLHPTMKPVELIERALVNSSKAGDLVLDLFGGSGSTLIACERTGRSSRPVNVSVLKSEFYGWLKLDMPTVERGEAFPASYGHFPQLGEEFFRQLTAEQLITRIVKGYPKSEWQKGSGAQRGTGYPDLCPGARLTVWNGSISRATLDGVREANGDYC
jgi:16S rRNA G966 N2-methylase RsmD